MALLAIAALALSTTSATPAETSWRTCIDRTKTNTEWAECGGRYVQQEDTALNAEWKRLMAATTGKTRTDLVAEQRAWLAYRKIACAFHANGDWGREGQVVAYPSCVAQLIERRTTELAAYAEDVGPK